MMNQALMLYVIGAAFGAGATEFYSSNRWLCRALWCAGAVFGLGYAKLVGLA